MSFVADSTCDLPEMARTRTYSAMVTLTNSCVNLTAERQAEFDIALRRASFVVGQDISPTNSIKVHAAGDYLEFSLDARGFDGHITERLAVFD